MLKITPEEILEYHQGGKIFTPSNQIACYTKGPVNSLHTRSGSPVLEIEKDPLTAYDYTAKANLVAVISNGTAILGLEIGEHSLPNRSWKGKLFYSRNLPISMSSIS